MPTLRRCSPLVIVCDIIVIVLYIRLKCCVLLIQTPYPLHKYLISPSNLYIMQYICHNSHDENVDQKYKLIDEVGLCSNIVQNLSQIMTRYGLDEWFWAIFKPTPTLPNFDSGQLFKWIGANNDQIWLPMGWRVILSNVRTNSNLT